MSSSTEVPSRVSVSPQPAEFVRRRQQPAELPAGDILPLRGEKTRGIARTSLHDSLRQQLIHNPLELLAYTTETVKDSAQGSVFRLRLPQSTGSCDCFLKVRVLRDPWVLLLRYLGWSRLRCAWHAALQFHKTGIFCPQPLAFVTQYGKNPYGKAQVHEYLLTLAVPDSLSLHQFLRTAYADRTPAEQATWRRILCVQLGRKIRRLHQLGFDHRDLKASNLLVRGIGRRNPAPCIVDLEGARRWPILPQARRRQNLVRLNLSADAHPNFTRSDRLRFLLEYLGTEDKPHWKQHWRKLAGLSVKRRRQFERQQKTIH